MVKIGLMDPEIALLKGSLKKKTEINASKIYSPRGRHARVLTSTQWFKNAPLFT